MELLEDREKTCPKCGNSGKVGEKFGVRRQRDRITAQSHCKECRSSKKEPDAPRVVAPSPLQGGPTPVYIPGNEDKMREIYKEYFPDDKAGSTRAWKFMAQKVTKKLNRIGIKWISDCDI